ncbi:hypothetical protein SAMN04488570_0687 [Nocardioides scoriae]|uniref:Amine oxidase domain-containing protein n=1 Tax=Nocardioides scoriae TaxID=642780 RepID=A0A1H1MVC4_9ACTN|nr:FAD-dependent oxidoreductase [Nocardioides scoriae]SDR90588.1 hypothetical protein SAMN04488570_0687 [Nocardioides scoriae]
MSTSGRAHGPVVVVGAGIAGVTCARELRAAGLDVRVLDRGRRLGGRMASRTLAGRPVDTGASYFTGGDERFDAVVRDWEARGVARRWTDTFHVLAPGQEPTTKSGPVRWGAGGGMRSLVEDLARGLDVQQHEVASVRRRDGVLEVDGEPAAAVVLAMPDAQARRLLDPTLASASATDRAYEPVLALSAVFDRRDWDDPGRTGDRFDGAFVNDHDVLAWIADDGRRRGDDAPVLVAHSTPGFAQPRLDDPAAAGSDLLDALRELLALGAEPTETHVQRWSLARPTGSREPTFHLSEDLVGLCGDGWGPVSKVQGAWVSGHDLGVELARRLG